MDVEVAGGTTLAERRQQHPAFQHEPVHLCGGGQPGEQALQRVQRQQLLRVTALAAGKPLEREVAITTGIGSGEYNPISNPPSNEKTPRPRSNVERAN